MPVDTWGVLMSKAEEFPLLAALPDWVPAKVVNYLRHTEAGQSLRDVARVAGVNASTVMRQVRHYEARRDDPLMDEALRNLALRQRRLAEKPPHPKADEPPIEIEGSRILAKLAEAGAMMVLAPDMEKAIVLREMASGKSQRTAVFTREIAQALILKDWISCKKSGKIALYEITAKGRQMAAQLAAQRADPPFAQSARLWARGEGAAAPRALRLAQSETPLQALARRRDKLGNPFLSSDLLRAADCLREDFELAEIAAELGRNWEELTTMPPAQQMGEGRRRAQERLRVALLALGPELSAIAIGICCYHEGIEEAEQRMGWAARSGKVVLRIALQRLRRHYGETYGPSGPLLG